MEEKKSHLTVVKDLDEQIAKANIAKSLEIEKALKSNNIDDIYKAKKYIESIQPKNNEKPQSLLLDPQTFGGDGYREKTFRLSYEMLRAMSRTTIVKSIIKTRIDQVLAFMTPQKDKYSKGFVIRPKNAKLTDSGIKLTKEQERRVEELTKFIMDCGDNENAWHGDDIHSFTKKFMQDSLGLDQGVFEIIRNRGGEICEFIATDGASYRIADSHNDELQSNRLTKGKAKGYLPYYVQVFQSRIVAEFYPWELCFAIRNPQTDMFSNGYGRSELEDLIENVTSMLNADQYNANYFKVGSNPKGILKVTGNVNNNRIEEFKNHWQAQMAGVRNSHKMAVIEADKMDFISTQTSNKDMEYAKYQEFLIKVSCAHYTIDPSEIGFPMQGSSENQSGFGGNNGLKEKLDYSKSKGLHPLLVSYQRWINKYIINPKDPDYEFVIEGLDVESPQVELDNDVKAVANWSTVNEIRRKRGMPDIEGGDIILNPIFLQQIMAQQQQQQEEEFQRQQQEQEQQNDNPFMKSLSEDLNEIFSRAN